MSRATREFDLSQPRGEDRANPPKEIHTTLPIVAVTKAEADAKLHVGDAFEDGLGVTVREGFRECLAPDDRLFLTNPEGSGTLEVVLTDEEDLLPGYGGTGGSAIASISPTRLPGSLANGETIDPGEELAETVDVAGGDILRARALVDGMVALEQTNVQTARRGSLAIDRDRERLYVTDHGGADVEEFDISNPADPVLVDTLTLSTANGNLGQVQGATYDEVNQVLVVTGEDGTDTLAFAIDTSTLGTLSSIGSAVVVAGSINLPQMSGRHAAHPGTETALVRTTNQAMHVVDYGGGSVTNPQSFGTSNRPSDPAIDRARDLAVFIHDDTGFDNAHVRVFGIASDGTYTLINDQDLGGDTGRGDALRVDDQDQLLFWYQGGGIDDLVMFDFASPTSLQELDRLSVITSYATFPYIDRSGSQPVLYAQKQTDGRWKRLTYRSGTLTDIGDDGFSGDSGSNLIIYGPAEGLHVYHFDNINNDLETWAYRLGQVALQLVPLLTTGARAETGRSTILTLTSGVEGMVDLDLVGEASVAVVMKNRGTQQGTIQFVETFVETV